MPDGRELTTGPAAAAEDTCQPPALSCPASYPETKKGSGLDLGGPVWRQELDSMNLKGPLQLRILHDSVNQP